MKKTPAIIWRLTWESLFVVVLLVIVWRTGREQLADWNGPASSLTNDLFIPAVMMNAGHGFSNVDPANIPTLRAFLDFQQHSFDLAQIPSDVTVMSLHPYQEFHRYLVYSVAVCWHILGLSWDSMQLLILAYFFLTCLAVYGICRLAMNPLFSFLVAVTFAYSRPVLWTLSLLRDFAKAPFILATAFLLGIVVARALTRRQLIAMALLTGLVLGVGMGIRRDMMVFLPISAFVFVTGRLKVSKSAASTKILAILVLVLAFIIAGWPVHRALARERYLAAQDTIMGFSSYSDHELGLIRAASYEKHSALNDLYSTLRAHYAAALGITSEAEVYAVRCNNSDYDFEMKNAFVKQMIKTFPADMLTRAYASVLRIGTGIVTAPNSPARYGLWFIVAGFVMIAAWHPLRAWLILTVMLFFCGYTSLQFAIRHAFHMSFLPFFFMGFVVHQGGMVALRAAGWGPGRTHDTDNPGLRFDRVGRVGIRAAVWLLLTAMAFVVPLQLARHWQTGKVNALREAYATAALVPVEHTILRWDGRVLFALTEAVGAAGNGTNGLLGDFGTGMVVADFSTMEMTPDIRAVYEWEGDVGDFGGPVNVSVQTQEPSSGARLYIPVHEQHAGAHRWSRFVGLSMSEQTAAHFQGYHKGKDLRDFGLLINMLIPVRADRFLGAQQVAIPWDGCDWSPYYPYGVNFDLPACLQEIKGLLAAKRLEEATEVVADALERYSGSVILVLLHAAILENAGHPQQAHEVCAGLINMFPKLPVAYEQVDAFFDEHGGVRRRYEAWTSMMQGNPAAALAHIYGERAAQELSLADGFEEMRESQE